MAGIGIERIGQVAVNVRDPERGVAFASEPRLVARLETHDLHLAFFHDSEGNPLALMGELPRA